MEIDMACEDSSLIKHWISMIQNKPLDHSAHSNAHTFVCLTHAALFFSLKSSFVK